MNKLRTVPASVDEKILKFSIQVVSKTASSANNLQSAFCFMLIHVQLQQLPAARAQAKTSYKISLFIELA